MSAVKELDTAYVSTCILCILHELEFTILQQKIQQSIESSALTFAEQALVAGCTRTVVVVDVVGTRAV